MISNCFKLFLFIIQLKLIFSASPQQWANRTIYQLLTDRFSKPLNSSNEFENCKNIESYCGGKFKGIEQRLDYIQNLGFDAIWISPIPENTKNGYHGYWMKDLFKINSFFGSENDLKSLIDAAHARDMFVMLDIVANHVGPIGNDFSQISPFNNQNFYHQTCAIRNFTCNTKELLDCRLELLPDLNQNNVETKQYLLKFVSNVIYQFKIDGLRIDTGIEVPQSFWIELKQLANVYIVGEVLTGDANCFSQYSHAMGSALSYPMFFTVRNVFNKHYSMQSLVNQLDSYAQLNVDASLLASFVENHDNPRWLHENNNIDAYKSALVFNFMSIGVPIGYYGSEQLFNGGNDPFCREPLWPSRFNQQGGIYQWLKLVLSTRKLVLGTKMNILKVENNFIAFQRDNKALILLTNQQTIGRLQANIVVQGWNSGQWLCNVFWPKKDCVKVDANGQLTVYLDHGEQKIYLPRT